VALRQVFVVVVMVEGGVVEGDGLLTVWVMSQCDMMNINNIYDNKR
jgi:hypothetical protein